MSKDKGAKNIKKAPATTPKKKESDYQTGKKSSGGNDSTFNKKK